MSLNYLSIIDSGDKWETINLLGRKWDEKDVTKN